MARVVLITGASRGIGAATARLAAARGYSVCVNYRRNRAAAETVVRDVEAAGARAIAVAADVGVEADVVRLFEACDASLGPARRAGEQRRHPRDADARRSDGRRRGCSASSRPTSSGAFLCAREAVRRMSTRHGGRGGAIVNVSSGAARLGSPGEYVDYAASKGAVDTLTIGLAREVAEEGIRVNAVRAGFIYTDIHAERRRAESRRSRQGPRADEARRPARTRWRTRSSGCCPTKRRTPPARSST